MNYSLSEGFYCSMAAWVNCEMEKDTADIAAGRAFRSGFGPRRSFLSSLETEDLFFSEKAF